MASSQYSILRQYTPYVSPYNIDLIKDIAMYKQGKIDAAREKIYTQMDYLMGQEIDKAEARTYMEDKMSSIISNINEKFRGMDFSSDGVTRAIQGEISSVLDDTVINAIAGTKEGRRMKKLLSDMQINHPELYSGANAYVAMKPYTEWLNDGKAGSRLAPLQYTPYTDYNKELKDRMESIRKLHKGTKIQIPITDKDGNPTGAMQEVTKDMLTPEQVAALAVSGLSDKARQQMQIEAIYMVDSNPALYSFDSVQRFAGEQIAKKQQYINALTADLAGAGSDPARKEQIENEIKRSKSELVGMKNEFSASNRASYNPYNGAMSVIENNFANNAAAAYAYDNSSYIIKADELYWKTAEFNQRERLANLKDEQWRAAFEYGRNKDIAEFEYQKAKDEADFGLKVDKLNMQYEFGREKLAQSRDLNDARIKKLLATSGKGGGRAGSQAMLSGIEAPNGATIVKNAVETKEINVYKKTNDNFEKAYSDLVTSGSRLATALGEENMKNINESITRKMNDETSGYKYLTNEERLMKYLKENGGLSNDMIDKLPISQRKAASEAYLDLNKAVDGMDIQNDRIKRENEVRKNTVGRIAENVDSPFSGDVQEKYALALSLNDITDNYRKESIYDDGTSHISKVGFSSIDLANMQSRAKDYGIDVSKILSFDEKSGRFFLDEDKFDSLNRSGKLSDAEVVFFGTMASMADGGGRWRMTDGERDLYRDIIKGVNRANEIIKDSDNDILEIRKEYINLSAPNSVVYSAEINSKESGYNEMLQIRNFFTGKMPSHPINKNGSNARLLSFTLTETGTADNGERLFTITANHTGERSDKDSIEVSESELVGSGISVGSGENKVDIGGYDSGIIKPTFGGETNMWYPKMLENSGISSIYASIPATMKHISDIINASDNKLSDMPDQKIWLLNAAQEILENSGKLAVQVAGYDPKTSYGYGFETRLYIMENGIPKEIGSFDTPNVWFADSISKELAMCPQKKIVDFVNAALSEEIQDMINEKEGGTMPQSLNRNGKLMKLLNAVRG